MVSRRLSWAFAPGAVLEPVFRSSVGSSAQPAPLRRSLLAHILMVTVPPAVLLFVGKAIVGGYGFWLLFLALAIRLVLRSEPNKLLCLVLALAPFMNLLRDFAFYNVVTACLIVSIAYCWYRSPEALSDLRRRCPLVVPLLGIVTIYYSVSFALTGDYSVNFRFFELALGVCAFLLAARDRSALGGVLTGLMISSVSIGVAMLPHVNSEDAQRLGMMEIEGVFLGNPVQLGVPLALSVLALTVDGGAWLGLERRWVRIAFQAASFGLLILTTSRASWLVVAGGVVVVLLFGRGQRLRMLVLIGLGVASVQLLLHTRYREGLEKGLERTFSEDRSAANRTSGRSDQWVVASRALGESTGSLLHGYGPGLGPATYARFSREVSDVHYAVGRQVALHSLYMQVGVEAGLLGLVPLIGGLLIILVKAVRWSAARGLVFPLVAFVGFVLIAVTVSGNDTVSAAFLGMGFLTAVRPAGATTFRPSNAGQSGNVAHLTARPVQP